MTKSIFWCLKAMEETLDLELENLSSNSHSVLMTFMILDGYLDSNSLSFLVCKNENSNYSPVYLIEILYVKVSWNLKHDMHAFLYRQLIYMDHFTLVVPDEWLITDTDLNLDKVGVCVVIQQLLPYTDDIQTASVHKWESTYAKYPMKKEFILRILRCEAVLFEMPILPKAILSSAFQSCSFGLYVVYFTHKQAVRSGRVCRV